MDQAAKFFNDWLKGQQGLVSAWAENMRQASRDALSSWCRPGGYYQALGKAWMDSLRSAVSSPRARKDETAAVVGDAAAKAVEGQGIYARLFDMWVPLMEAMQRKALDTTCYMEMLDPAKLKELTDRAFGFSPDSVMELMGLTAGSADAAASSSRKFLEPWLEALEKDMALMPAIMQGRSSPFLDIFHNNFDAFDGTFGKVFHIPPVGKDREKIELFMREMDDVAVYMAKLVEYQHIMYVTGLRAMEKLIRAVAEKVERDEIRSFEDVFGLWIDINEKEYLSLGRTRDYARLQGEMMNAGLGVRRHYFKLMELYLYDFPVALRSEMDDLYRTIYDLKKKIKKLEGRIRITSGEEVAA